MSGRVCRSATLGRSGHALLIIRREDGLCEVGEGDDKKVFSSGGTRIEPNGNEYLLTLNNDTTAWQVEYLRWCRLLRQLIGRSKVGFALSTPVGPRDVHLGSLSGAPDHLIPHAPPARPRPCQDRSLSDAGELLRRKRPGSRSALLRMSISYRFRTVLEGPGRREAPGTSSLRHSAIDV